MQMLGPQKMSTFSRLSHRIIQIFCIFVIFKLYEKGVQYPLKMSTFSVWLDVLFGQFRFRLKIRKYVYLILVLDFFTILCSNENYVFGETQAYLSPAVSTFSVRVSPSFCTFRPTRFIFFVLYYSDFAPTVSTFSDCLNPARGTFLNVCIFKTTLFDFVNCQKIQTCERQLVYVLCTNCFISVDEIKPLKNMRYS